MSDAWQPYLIHDLSSSAAIGHRSVMERLGIYIFVFLFLGLTFFERARTHGETGSLWRVLGRNGLVLALAVANFLLLGADIIAQGWKFSPLHNFHQISNYQPPYDAVTPAEKHHWMIGIIRDCLLAAASSLLVAAGIWELHIGLFRKWLILAIFCTIVYPGFGFILTPDAIIGKLGFYDHAGALLIWALPACYVIGIRLTLSARAFPEERKHDLKGVKILPGIKHRFLFSRGIGFTMIFLVLNTVTLVDHSWILSKTLTLISASFTIIFCNLLFFGMFGRNPAERYSYAPPFFAIMSALIATQSCNQYESQQAILAAVVATFSAMLILRIIPLKLRYWDPICSLPIFLAGGISGTLLASLTPAATIFAQLGGVVVCLLLGGGSGLILSQTLLRSRRPAANPIAPA